MDKKKRIQIAFNGSLPLRHMIRKAAERYNISRTQWILRAVNEKLIREGDIKE